MSHRRFGLLIISSNILFFLVCYFIIQKYYQNGLPYYDSVGSYWNMFSIMNTTKSVGLKAGIIQASGFSLSWLQSFFAVMTASVLPRTPEALVLLNFICLFISQTAIFLCGRTSGLSRNKSLALAFMPLVPGILVSWQGGYIDMARDASMFSLLTASYFFTWYYLWQQAIGKGIFLGLVLGLTQWSRGNALPYLLIAIGSVFITFMLKNHKSLKDRIIVKILLPIFISSFFIIPFYWKNFHLIITKYSQESWALGGSIWDSSVNLFISIIILFVGSSKTGAIISTIVIIILLIALTLLVKSNLLDIKFKKNTNKKTTDLLISGVIYSFLIIIFNSVILRISVPGKIVPLPFIPLIVGFISISCWIVNRVQFKSRYLGTLRFKKIWIFILLVVIIGFNTVRIYYSMPEVDINLHQQAIKTAGELKNKLGGKRVAFLWTKHINVHDLNYYITQNGGLPIQAGSSLKAGIDIEMPLEQNKDLTVAREEFAQALRNYDNLVVSEDATLYDNPFEFFFIFKYGRPVIENLFADKNYNIVYRYKIGNIPFVLLEKKQI